MLTSSAWPSTQQAAKSNWKITSAARRAQHTSRLDDGRRWWSAGIGGNSGDDDDDDEEEEEEEEEEEIRPRERKEGDDSYDCWPRGDKTKTPVRRGGGMWAVVPASSSGLVVPEVNN